MVPQVILWEEICVEWGRGLAVLDLMMDVQLRLLFVQSMDTVSVPLTSQGGQSVGRDLLGVEHLVDLVVEEEDVMVDQLDVGQ